MIGPIIGYENLLRATGAIISSSGDAAGFPAANAYDWNPVTYWQPSGSGAQYIQLQLPAAKQANYFAFYAQTLYSYAGTIQLQWSNDGSTWNNAFSAFTVLSSAPVYLRFNPINAIYWRVAVNSTTAAFLGVVSFGVEMITERGCFVGFQPPTLSRNTETSNNMTQTGAFLGRTIIRKYILGAIALDSLTQNWVRYYWLSFVKHAEQRPWFMMWNAERNDEVAFCYSTGFIPPCINTMSGIGFMSAGVNYQGNVE